jgi:glycine oxidase
MPTWFRGAAASSWWAPRWRSRGATRPTAGAILDLLREAWRILPGVYDLAVAELSVGFRPVVRDHRPLIGAAGTRGLYVATGHFRNGVLLAPATAHYLAEWITEGAPPPALAPFGVERLETTAVATGTGLRP